MPSCVVKWCINRSHLHKKSVGISYYVFPKKENYRQLWTKAVRLERQEEDWIPKKTTRICSVHFKYDDFYTSKKGLNKLKTNAIPICTMVNSIVPSITMPILPVMSPQKFPSKSNKEYVTEKRIPEITSQAQKCRLIACPCCGCMFNISVNDHAVGNQIMKQPLQAMDSATEDQKTPSADLIRDTSLNITPSSASITQSALNTPKTNRLENMLRKKTLLSEKRLSKIISLKKQSKRLLKKYKLLKAITATLKKNERLRYTTITSCKK